MPDFAFEQTANSKTLAWTRTSQSETVRLSSALASNDAEEVTPGAQLFGFDEQVHLLEGKGQSSPKNMEVSINGGTSNGWFIRENPIKMDDLGVPPFQETFILRQWK